MADLRIKRRIIVNLDIYVLLFDVDRNLRTENQIMRRLISCERYDKRRYGISF